MTSVPINVSEVQEFVLETSRLTPKAGGTKSALSTPREGFQALDMAGIQGMIDYQPGEYTFTAYAGTRIVDVNELLLKNNQYLPFDPPLVKRGATLGGTVASGLSGPGRYHYGGVRDFLLGIRYVNSYGQIIRAGGKVVKNAAGFDLAKLMVGSRGELGLLVELSFKVFPKPDVFVTLRCEFPTLESALHILYKASVSGLDIDSLDLVTGDSSTCLWIRIGGFASVMLTRITRLKNFLGDCEVIQGAQEVDYWGEMREFLWVPSEWVLVKVPLTPELIPAIEQSLVSSKSLRRYSCAGQVGWFAYPEATSELDQLLLSLKLSGMVIFGNPNPQFLGRSINTEFYRRVKNVMDPDNRFGEA